MGQVIEIAQDNPNDPRKAKPKNQTQQDGVSLGTGGMINVFYGEFLYTPSALEWSLNWCSHACQYCFANINSPTRKGNASKALRQVAEVGRRATLTDLYLRNKYPVCIANKSDAFSDSNYRETVPVMIAMKEAGIPMQFQTKGGKGIDEVLDGLPPSVWYITIAQIDDAIRKRIEPNAPPLSARYELIDQLKELGHHVVVGVNPAVPEWLDDPLKLMELLAKHGVWGVWVEAIHLSHKQITFMTPVQKKSVGESVLGRLGAAGKKFPEQDAYFLAECMEAAEACGLETFSGGWPKATDFFMPWREVYPATLPIIQDFVNACFDLGLDERTLLSFDDYINAIEAAATPFMTGKHRIGDYMRVASYRTIEHISNWSDWMTFRQLLWFAWQNPGNKLAPTSNQVFHVATDPDEEDVVPLVDDKGAYFYVFYPQGSDNYYMRWPGPDKTLAERGWD